MLKSTIFILTSLTTAFGVGCAALPTDTSTPASVGQSLQGESGINSQVTSVDAYVLGQGDQISIQVFDEPDLSIQSTVGASGAINYSYLGDLQVTGKTPFQLEQHIAGLLSNGFLVNPSVNVSVVQFRPFFIGGEVRSPGSFPFQPGLTLDKAIALAGGLTERASTRRMFIVRSGDAPSSLQKTTLDAAVGPGDTITIKEGFF